jgi:hypothetical protein
MIRSLLILTACSSLTGCRDEPSVFNGLDANQDHRLSLTELEQGVTAGLFKTYDADQDRIITTIEWRKLDPDGDPIFMHQRDDNRDGRITPEEALSSVHRRGFCRDLLNKTDTNQDGVVDSAEAGRWASDHPEIIDRLHIGD